MSADAHRIPRDHPLRKAPWIALGSGLVLIVLASLLGRGEPGRVVASYLVSFCYFLSLSLGGLFFVLWQFATRSGWSVVVRRVAENIMGVLPSFIVLFVPIALGMHSLYHWSHADAVARDAILTHKAPYLNETFFLIRAGAYLLIWAVLAYFFRSTSVRQDETGAPDHTRTLQKVAPPSIIIFGVTVTFASFDWLMSLDPHWYSTIFGVYYFAGCLVGIMALLAVSLALLQRLGFLVREVTADHYQDIGKLLFAFSVFWSYIAFSQFMLIWYANIPEETVWYAHRWHGSWKAVSLLLIFGHFALPFFFLMSRHIKRRVGLLVTGALWLLAMHYVDLYWLVMPTFYAKGAPFGPIDVMIWLGLGLVCFGLVIRLALRSALLPVNDPRLPESLSFENS